MEAEPRLETVDAVPFFCAARSPTLRRTPQEVCDRVAILYKGRIVALGEVDTLMNSGDRDLEAVFLRITEEEDAAHRGETDS